MRLRHIEVFHAVYSTGSVTRAAEMLSVSQPSVSKVLAHVGLALDPEIIPGIGHVPLGRLLTNHKESSGAELKHVAYAETCQVVKALV